MGIKILKTEYFPVCQLDKDEKGTVEIVRSGDRQYVLRTMNGNISSYTALQKIASPYLPKIEYAAFDGEKTIVLEEYISGGKDISSLTEEKEIISAFCELCDVLSLLHSRGIVHRDIKPSNILVAPDGHIRLIDFDASRRYDDSKDSDTRYLGTKGYAPPEQFGYSQTNAASDIYSLGVTLKTVLGDKSEKRKFRRIIRKCTEFDPKNRYQSALDVKKALKFGGMSAFLPALLSAAAVLACALYFFSNIDGGNSEYLMTAAETDTLSLSETTTVASSASATAVTTTSVAASTSEVITTVPTAEETTVVPETEDTSAETLTEETTETSVTSVFSTQSTASTRSAETTTTAKTTTAAKTTEAPKAETTTVPSASETVSQTTSPTGLPAGKTFKKLLTCVTDGTKAPAFTRYEFNPGQYCDVLNEPFEFVADEAVLGVWSQVNYTSHGTAIFPKMTYNLQKKSLLDTFPKRLIFNEDGTCYYEGYTNYGGNLKLDYSSILLNWTYGVIEDPAVEEYFFYQKYYLYKDESGEEYLFIEHKNGDYMNAKIPENGLNYYIYERCKGK